MGNEQIDDIITRLESNLGTLSDREVKGVTKVVTLGFDFTAIIYAYTARENLLWGIGMLRQYHAAFNNTDAEKFRDWATKITTTENERIAEITNAIGLDFRTLSFSDVSALVGLLQKGFEVEAITYVYNAYNDLQWVIEFLYDFLKTYKNTQTESVQSRVDAFVERRNAIVAVIQHINKPCSDKERKTIINWVRNDFSAGLINYAVDICVEKTGIFNLVYVEKVLNNWRKWGLTTLEEVKENEKARKARMQHKVVFKNDTHKEKYNEILKKMTTADAHHSAIAYLLAFDENISSREERISECFIFTDDAINPDALRSAWVNETDRRILSLAFNLWNSAYTANVSDVLSDSTNMEYLFEAIKIRFGTVSATKSDEE